MKRLIIVTILHILLAQSWGMHVLLAQGWGMQILFRLSTIYNVLLHNIFRINYIHIIAGSIVTVFWIIRFFIYSLVIRNLIILDQLTLRLIKLIIKITKKRVILRLIRLYVLLHLSFYIRFHLIHFL